ncbi:cilia-and flagella-associated protein 96 [Amia ocellicauda]|uniref:cilia-and flagella-associated protein 96 n=1 Tax=Amia ocellicauda TaxID=2972642 RepID=UPI003463D7A6|nr:CD047 protein [Amia calva]
MPQEGKSDMERIGLFKEMGYVTIGDKYSSQYNRPFNEAAHKKKQMMPGGTKLKSALQVGYFDSQFKRIFENESYSNPVKIRRQYRLQQSKKNTGKAFLPSNGEKKPSGYGSYYGTLGGPIPAMSALQVPRKPYKSPGKNVLTNPPKKGTGYGFPNVTLSKLHSYSADPYERAKEMRKKELAAHRSMLKGGSFRLNLHPNDFFDGNPYKFDKPLPPVKKSEGSKKAVAPFKPSSPAKQMGGMKSGTFDTYPSHSADAYVVKKPKPTTTNKEGKIFHPTPGPKSMPVKSILSANVAKGVNSLNYMSVPSVMAY